MESTFDFSIIFYNIECKGETYIGPGYEKVRGKVMFLKLTPKPVSVAFDRKAKVMVF